MKNSKTLRFLSKGFIFLSGFSMLSVSLMAFRDPQSVMDLVAVKLENSDAYSSIRGVYGGVGLSIFISLLMLSGKEQLKALAFLCLLWGLYALSRIITIFAEGALGAFGRQWLIIESLFFLIAATLFILNKRSGMAKKAGL